MRMFLTVAKYRLLPNVGWTICSILLMFGGGLSGIGIGYLGLAMDLIEPTDRIFSGLSFLTLPFTGGIISLVAMHALRITCWAKLQRRYKEKNEKWSWKYTMGIILFDEAIWLIAFVAICAIIVIII